MDLYIFQIINNISGKWVLLDNLGIFFAKYFEYFLLLFLLLLLIFKFKDYWKMIITALISAAVSRFVIASSIRYLWFRPRPFVNDNVNLLLNDYNPNEASFPSGHATFYFALSTVIYGYNKKLGIFFYVASFLIVLARVFVGIHWPSDILGGALIGIVVGWIGYKVSKKMINKKTEI